MTLFSQRDFRWRWKKLGNPWYSRYKIGGSGCLLTCFSMLLSTRPDTLNDLFERYGAFDINSLILWPRVHAAAPSLTFLQRLDHYDNTIALQAITDHGFVLVEVDAAPIGNPGGRHWVVFTGSKQLFDPWTGRIRITSDFPTLTGLSIIHRN